MNAHHRMSSRDKAPAGRLRLHAGHWLVAIATVARAAPALAQDRTIGQTVDDAKITAQVKIEIAKTEGLGGAFDINVDTYGQKVMLAGFVDTPETKRKAEEAARRVSGVSEVVNNLEVKRAPGSKVGN